MQTKLHSCYNCVGKDRPEAHEINKYVVTKYAPEWRELGEALGMSPEILNIIHTDHPNSCEERCKTMLRRWLQQDPSATWGTLVDAIHSSTISSSITTAGINLL